MEVKRMSPSTLRLSFVNQKLQRKGNEEPRVLTLGRESGSTGAAPTIPSREVGMLLPITALRLAVAAAVENVTTPMPGDFPEGDVIIWRRRDEGADNSTWLPPPLPPSVTGVGGAGTGEIVDPGFAPDYHKRFRYPQNSTDVLTVADIAEIERLLVNLNATENATSTESEKPVERVRRSADDDGDDDAQPQRGQPEPEVFPESVTATGHSEDAQVRPVPQLDDAASAFFGKFLGVESSEPVGGAAGAPSENLVAHAEDNGDEEQARGRRQATFTPPAMSLNKDSEVTTLAPTGLRGEAPEPTTESSQNTGLHSTGDSSSQTTPAPGISPQQPEPQFPSYPLPPYPYPQGYPQYPQRYPYPQGFYPHFPQGQYPQYPGGFYPGQSGIIDPGFAPNPLDQLLRRGLQEQRRRGGGQPFQPGAASPWQGFPGSQGIIDPGFAPHPIDPLLLRDLNLRGDQGAANPQQQNQSPSQGQPPMVFVEGAGQGFPPNAGDASQGLMPPRPAEDAFVQGLPSVPAQPSVNEN